MGQSGAGKSSLLNVISQRAYVLEHKGEKLSGQIKFNDKQIDKDVFCKFAGYVMQEDILYEHFTLRELLMF